MQFRKQYSIKEIVNINNNLMYLISKLIFKDYMIKMIIPMLSEPTVRTLRATIPGNESQLNFLILGN
jgi:hypothetical protein